MSGRSNSDRLENESGMVENVGVAVEIASISQKRLKVMSTSGLTAAIFNSVSYGLVHRFEFR